MNIILKWIFDRVASLLGLLILWPVLLVVAILIKLKMPGGPVFFVQKRVGKDGKLFDCHKFRTMRPTPAPSLKGRENTHTPTLPEGEGDSRSPESLSPSPIPDVPSPTRSLSPEGKGSEGWSTVSVAGDSRITPFGAKLRHWKIDELPELWDVLIGNMSFVGPRPDVPGYADKLEGDDRVILKLRPGITGPATLKYRLEDEMIAEWVAQIRSHTESTDNTERVAFGSKSDKNLFENLPEGLEKMTDQELAVWYNDNVIYPDKVRLNKYYYEHYSFWKDIQMIVCTVLGKKMKYAGEEI